MLALAGDVSTIAFAMRVWYSAIVDSRSAATSSAFDAKYT